VASTSADRPGNPCVAIVSDGSGLPPGGDLTETLSLEAELVGRLAGLPARQKIIPASDAAGLAAGIRALPADIGAVLLTAVAPARARQAQQELRDGGARPLVTREDATAIALAALATRTLAAAGRSRGSRVVLAGARELPLLITLLMAAGVTDLTTWEPADAAIFPLHGIVFGADVVIDLAGALPPRVAARLGGTTVLTGADAAAAPYAAAGLLHAAVTTPGLVFGIDVYCACADVLVRGAGTTVSVSQGTALTRLVAEAVSCRGDG
jgi:malate dehydrogenase (oxaloacetate-decarboxylating)